MWRATKLYASKLAPRACPCQIEWRRHCLKPRDARLRWTTRRASHEILQQAEMHVSNGWQVRGHEQMAQ